MHAGMHEYTHTHILYGVRYINEYTLHNPSVDPKLHISFQHDSNAESKQNNLESMHCYVYMFCARRPFANVNQKLCVQLSHAYAKENHAYAARKRHIAMQHIPWAHIAPRPPACTLTSCHIHANTCRPAHVSTSCNET